MLALTKKTDYALVALTHLAKQSRGVVSAREIARVYRLPLPILTNILKTLAQTGVLMSERGAAGGYGLARPAESITLHELIVAIEGPFQFVRCALSDSHTGQSPCDIELCCPIRLPAQRIRERLKVFLEQVTLAELLVEESATSGQQEAQPQEPQPNTVEEFAT